jgi:hypothetical protein
VKEAEAALAVEQAKKQEFATKIEFYGNAYQKLQGKLAGMVFLTGPQGFIPILFPIGGPVSNGESSDSLVSCQACLGVQVLLSGIG